MDKRVLNLTAALALAVNWAMIVPSSAAPAATQDAMPSIAASAVGRWLYDLQGNTIGSVRGLADGGRTAIIMVGSYFQPGSYEARVPASALSIINGKVTLQTETAEAPNTSATDAITVETKPGSGLVQPDVHRLRRLLSPYFKKVGAWSPPREVGR